MKPRRELEDKKKSNASIVEVGAGPVGLMIAIQLAEERKDISICILERHKEYKRLQRLRLDMRLVKSPQLRKKLLDIIDADQAKKVGEHHIDIPIQILEKCLLAHAKKLGVDIQYKQFMTKEQFKSQLEENKVNNQQELEEKLGIDVIVDIEQIKEFFPRCNLLIGTDGARSSVRERISNKDEKIVKKDLRNMIELKYQVKGEVHKLSVVQAPLTQPLLDGFLCSEHVKYNAEKDVTDVTLNFLVDEETFNDPSLEGVNAKNLLPLSLAIPTKLSKAINLWVQTRGDTNIIFGSPTLNKTTLSIYTSQKYCEEMQGITILLGGDASCGFPFMNGLNLGIENGTYLVDLILKYWNKILMKDPVAMHQLVEEYSTVTSHTFEKGSKLVKKANKKINIQENTVAAMHYSSLAITYSLQYFRSAHHEIFSAHSPYNFTDLESYINNNNKSKEKKELAKNLLLRLSESSLDFDYIKAILVHAYLENKEIEETKKQDPITSLFSGTKTLLKFPLFSKVPKKEVEAKSNPLVSIPKHLTSKDGKEGRSQGLHKIIYNLFNRVNEFEGYYQRRVGEMVRGVLGAEAGSVMREFLPEMERGLKI